MASNQSLNILEILSESAAWSEHNEMVSEAVRVSGFQILTQYQALLEPFNHINSVRGKEIRGLMLEAFNAWLEVPKDKLMIISRVISMLHTASLL